MKEIHVVDEALATDDGTKGFYPMNGEQWVTADKIDGLEKRVEELTAENEFIQNQLNDMIEAVVTWQDAHAKMKAENQSLRDKLTAAGYKPESSVQEIQKSKEALDHLVKYQAAEAKEILAEVERLRAALETAVNYYPHLEPLIIQALGDEDE